MNLTDQIAEFLQENNTATLCWDPGLLEKYIDYYRAAGAVGVVRRRGEVIGVGIARPIQFEHAEQQARDRWAFHEEGEILFIDELAAIEFQAIPVLWEMMVERFGERPLVAGMRHHKLRCWDFEKYSARIQALELQKG